MCRILAFSTHSELALHESNSLANVSNTQYIEPIARPILELKCLSGWTLGRVGCAK